MNTKTRILAAGAAAALLFGTVNAQPGAPAGRDGMRVESARAHRGLLESRAVASCGADLGFHRGGLPFGAPIGTEIEVGFYAEEPAEGVEPTTTLALTVGVDSEAAFLDDFAAAREDASYLVVEIGEQTRSIDLSDVAGEDVAAPVRIRAAHALSMLGHAGLEDGDTVTAVFYDGDPEAGGNELQTLAFTYGVDSAIGFRQDLADAAETADWVVVTLPPRTHAVDLTAIEARDAMGRFHPASGPR